MADRYFDDFEIGERFVSRGVTLSEAQILDFALRYDRFCRVANSAQSDLRWYRIVAHAPGLVAHTPGRLPAAAYTKSR